jgi:hypothetical protein
MSRKVHLFEVRLPLLPEGLDALLQFGAACDRQSGKSLKGTFSFFSFGGVGSAFW